MKLISCHIENFGNLSDRTFDFTDGLNTICLENGVGKSTLAAFIRVMFFGFENESKQDPILNEKKRYAPWQGGVFGGRLIFEANNKKYEIERVFGLSQKEKEKSFVLRDADTKLESKDFSEKIGEELFGINSESFLRTVYISQNNCESMTNDSINAKMGNLVDNTDDLNKYENVKEQLKKMSNQLAPKKNGELGKISSRITDLSVIIRAGEGIDENINETFKKSEADKKEYNELCDKQKVIQDKQKAVGVYKDKKALKEKYDSFIKQEKDRKANLDEIAKLFKGQIPDKEELVKKTKEYAELSDLKGECKGYEGINLDDIKEKNEALEVKLNKYELKFATGIPTDSEISRLIGEWEKRNEAKSSIKQRKATLQTLMDIDDDKKAGVEADFMKKAKNLLIIGIILFILGAVVAGLSAAGMLGDSIKMAGLGIGAAVLVTSIILLIMSAKKKKEGSNIVFPANPHLLNLRREIDEDEIFIKETYTATEDFFIRYHLNFDEYTVVNELFNLKNDIASYEDLKEHGKEDLEKNKEREAKYKELKEKLVNKEKVLTEYIVSLGYSENDNIREALENAKDKLTKFENAKHEYDQAANARKEFENITPDYDKLKDITLPENEESMEENEKKLSFLTERIQQLSKNIESYKRILDDYREKKEEYAAAKEELEQLQQKKADTENQIDIIEKTKTFLEEAKVALTNKYTGPITENFGKYYKMLEENGDTDKYVFDGHINLEYREQGKMRSTKTLSQGLKDLSGVALRMAFADAMYKDEKPFIIFDDPYVNLDEKRLKGGLSLLKDISKDHQVIYFTCHDSRVVDGASV